MNEAQFPATAIHMIDQASAYANDLTASPDAREQVRKRFVNKRNPNNHPYFLHQRNAPATSPKRDAYCNDLQQEINIGNPIGFQDIAVLLEAELRDYQDQFQLLNREIKLATHYFATNTEKEEVTVYVNSFGRATLSPPPPVANMLILDGQPVFHADQRVYHRNDMQQLQEMATDVKQKTNEGVPFRFERAAKIASQMAQDKPVEEQDPLLLGTVLISQAEKTSDQKIQGAFERLSLAAQDY